MEAGAFTAYTVGAKSSSTEYISLIALPMNEYSR